MVLVDIYSVVSGYNKDNNIKHQNLTGIIAIYNITKKDMNKYQDRIDKIADIQKTILGKLKLGIGVFHLQKVMLLKDFNEMRGGLFKNYIVVKYHRGHKISDKDFLKSLLMVSKVLNEKRRNYG